MSGKYTTYITIAIIIYILVLGALQMYLFVNVSLLLLCSYFYFKKPDIVVMLFVVLLPTNGLYTTEANILGLLGPLTILHLFAFMILIKEQRYTSKREYYHLRIAILFTLFLLWFNLVYEFRNAFFDIYEVTWGGALKRFVKYFFRFGSVYLLIFALYKGKYVRDVINAVHIGVVFLILSSVFTLQLQELKFLTTDASENVGGYFTIERKSGFFGAGDVNSLGGLLATYIGFLLIMSYAGIKKTMIFVLIGLTFIGVIYTGSRTAIISAALIMVLFIFIKNPIQSKRLNKYILVLLIGFSLGSVFFLFNHQTRIVMSRFQDVIFETSTDNEGSRLFKWIYYLEDIAKNPETLIIGTNHELTLVYSRGLTEQRVPHNFYITALFHGGVFVLLIGLMAWYKLLKLALKERYLLLLAIPTFAISFYVSDWGYFQYFILFIVLSHHQINNYQIRLT